MNTNKIILVLFCFLLSLKLVKAQNNDLDSAEKVEIRIDPRNSIGATVSRFFDEVEFIPLETNKESLFGAIRQLEIVENHFIIFDSDTKSILIFTTDGKYKAKINSAGTTDKSVANNAFSINGFNIVNENSKNLIELKTKNHLSYFDLNGKFVKEVLVDKNYIKKVFIFSNSDVGIERNKLIKMQNDTSYYELALYNAENKLINSYFPYQLSTILNDDLISSGKSLFTSGQPNRIFYTRYFDYNIYSVDLKKALLSFKIVLPQNVSLPGDFMINPIYKGKRMEYLQKNLGKYFGVFNTYNFGNNLFFNLSVFGPGKKSFIYQIKENALISLKDLEPDQSSFFLPITDVGYLDEYNNVGFNLFKDGYLYNSYSSLAMFAFKEQSESKKSIYNAVLTEYFRKQNKKSNPVIIKLKPKVN